MIPRFVPTFLPFSALSLFVVAALSGPAAAQSPQTPQAPAPVSLATSDTGWQVICRPQDAARTRLACTITHEIFTSRDRSRILSVEITRADKAHVLTALTPVNVSLKDGVSLTANSEKLQSPFTTCQSNGCVARFDLQPKTMERIKAGKSLSFEFKDVQGAKVRTELSMNGFALAFGKSEQAN